MSYLEDYKKERKMKKLAFIVIGGLLVVGGCSSNRGSKCKCIKKQCDQSGSAGIEIIKKSKKNAGSAGIVIAKKTPKSKGSAGIIIK